MAEEIQRGHETNPFLVSFAPNEQRIHETSANVLQVNYAKAKVPKASSPFVHFHRTSWNLFLDEDRLEEDAMYNRRKHNRNERPDESHVRNGEWQRQDARSANVNQYAQNNTFNDYNLRFQQQRNHTFHNRYRLSFGDLVPEFDPSKTSITSSKLLSNTENLAKLYVSTSFNNQAERSSEILV